MTNNNNYGDRSFLQNISDSSDKPNITTIPQMFLNNSKGEKMDIGSVWQDNINPQDLNDVFQQRILSDFPTINKLTEQDFDDNFVYMSKKNFAEYFAALRHLINQVPPPPLPPFIPSKWDTNHPIILKEIDNLLGLNKQQQQQTTSSNQKDDDVINLLLRKLLLLQQQSSSTNNNNNNLEIDKLIQQIQQQTAPPPPQLQPQRPLSLYQQQQPYYHPSNQQQIYHQQPPLSSSLPLPLYHLQQQQPPPQQPQSSHL